MKEIELIEKYPEIFRPYEGNPGYVNYLDIPRGWLPLVDLMCGVIQDYINRGKTIENPDKAGGPNYITEPIPQVVCSQVKEKYGGLRFYTFGHDSYVEGVIKMATLVARNTCQDCGSNDDVKTTGMHWISTQCKTCRKE